MLLLFVVAGVDVDGDFVVVWFDDEGRDGGVWRSICWVRCVEIVVGIALVVVAADGDDDEVVVVFCGSRTGWKGSSAGIFCS